jgi:hypothetical protein
MPYVWLESLRLRSSELVSVIQVVFNLLVATTAICSSMKGSSILRANSGNSELPKEIQKTKMMKQMMTKRMSQERQKRMKTKINLVRLSDLIRNANLTQILTRYSTFKIPKSSNFLKAKSATLEERPKRKRRKALSAITIALRDRSPRRNKTHLRHHNQATRQKDIKRNVNNLPQTSLIKPPNLASIQDSKTGSPLEVRVPQKSLLNSNHLL